MTTQGLGLGLRGLDLGLGLDNKKGFSCFQIDRDIIDHSSVLIKSKELDIRQPQSDLQKPDCGVSPHH